MKNSMIAFLVATTFTFAAKADLQACESKAKKAALIFQNDIVAQKPVDKNSVLVDSKDEKLAGGQNYYEYSVNMMSLDKTQYRSVRVKTDSFCNIASTATE